MDNLTAFTLGMVHRGEELKVFDWVKAAEIIKARGATNASAGLTGDWEWTGGEIFRDGEPVKAEDTYVYLASTWATPELEVDGDLMDCFRMEGDTPQWDAGTYWPEEALRVLSA